MADKKEGKRLWVHEAKTVPPVCLQSLQQLAIENKEDVWTRALCLR
jgi:hypothetical protein